MAKKRPTANRRAKVLKDLAGKCESLAEKWRKLDEDIVNGPLPDAIYTHQVIPKERRIVREGKVLAWVHVPSVERYLRAGFVFTREDGLPYHRLKGEVYVSGDTVLMEMPKDAHADWKRREFNRWADEKNAGGKVQ